MTRSPALRVAALAVLGAGGSIAFTLQSFAPTPATDVPEWRVDQRAEQVTAWIEASRLISFGWLVLMAAVAIASVLLLIDLVQSTSTKPEPAAAAARPAPPVERYAAVPPPPVGRDLVGAGVPSSLR